jgi:neutral ceramidase
MTAFLVICGFLAIAELQAGVAAIDLTPPAEMHATLGGYGERMSRPAEGVHDPIFAKAVVLSEGSVKKYLILTADILAFPPAFKPRLMERLRNAGWQDDQVLLLPSHTHTSIDMSAINPAHVLQIKQIGLYHPEVFAWTLDRMEGVMTAASKSDIFVRVGTGSRQLKGWNRNRRRDNATTDDLLTVTRLDSHEGKPVAVLVNFTAHPTFMGPEHMLFSGDWPGHLQRQLERMIGNDVIVLFYNGAQGDQAPVARPQAPADRWEAAEQFGTELASEAFALWKSITPVESPPLEYGTASIQLPERQWHPDFMKTGGAEYGLSEALLQKTLPFLVPSKSHSNRVRLGDLLILGVPGEMAADLGLEIKRQASELTGVPHVTIGGLADEWVSYILPADEYQRGGYEASVSFYGSTLGSTIVEGVLTPLRTR